MSGPGFHADFAAALLSPDPAARPPWLAPHQAARFAVYRNNIRHGLIEALAAAYPVVRRLVGDDFFRATARLFVQAHPPRRRSLALYGEGFAGFLAGFAPARGVPYLADVARLERAWLESLHAADTPVLAPEALTGLDEALATARFAAHPAARLVRSDQPVVTVWRANRGERTGRISIEPRAEAALICRPGTTVSVRSLSPAAAAFAAALLSGASAAEAAAGDGLDIAEAFHHLLADGAFSAVRPA